jgi:hypothetical protein
MGAFALLTALQKNDKSALTFCNLTGIKINKDSRQIVDDLANTRPSLRLFSNNDS